MTKIDNVLRFYVLATTLKDKIRSGAEIWHISKKRLESVAEHIYGTCILAIGLDSEFNFDINIDKVIKMLVIHELEEVTIGDLTPFDDTRHADKKKIGEDEVEKILKDLIKKEEYMALTREYNAKNTKEAKFASYCDKLELMLQMKLYEDLGYSDMYSEENRALLNTGWIKKLIDNGAKTISDLFVDYHKPSFNGNETFDAFADFIRDNDISSSINNI
jgi:putative hydrolase of HD superfamily